MAAQESTMNTDHTTRARSPRRHDLDALRGFAMLLGIALHAALAYADFPWIAMNKETSPLMAPFFEVIHGFRLPLFFLMSGFFSAMLLQRRGVGGFLGHRWKRIGLPLLLGTLTIVPATWGVIVGGHVFKSVVPAPEREWGGEDGSGGIWGAAADGELISVQVLASTGVDVNEPDPRLATLPLAWAATGDHAEIVAFLLESGADPNKIMGDGSTPLHTACFFGAAESAALMLEAGADPTIRNAYGDTPADSLSYDRGAIAYIANLLGVPADIERIESGRAEIAPLLESKGAGIAAEEPPSALHQIIAGILNAELFMHLWFLWHLCLFACVLALLTAGLRALPTLRVPALLVSTPLCLVVLIPLTALTQSWQAGFGPDTSAALMPPPHVLAHYAVFFAFGALMYCAKDAADRLGRAWWVHLPVAAAACFAALRITHDPLAFSGLGLEADTASAIAPALQSVFVWTFSFGLIGLARLLLSRPSARVRYLSDSSYWLYVVHFPLVLAGQFALAYVALPPLVEFALLTVATTAVLLLSYRWFVRYTWIGRLLNGPRSRPAPAADPGASPEIGAARGFSTEWNESA